jgi:hypothetical protein
VADAATAGDPIYFPNTERGTPYLAAPDYSTAWIPTAADAPINYPQGNETDTTRVVERPAEDSTLVIYVTAGLSVSIALWLLGTRLALQPTPLVALRKNQADERS